ncbi:MAG TPA: AI-2E family transporter [Candidatus Saccharimonadia bacterium]|nr:AI-2E family transporter [Candidatus Saccharimonadia bacterium]
MEIRARTILKVLSLTALFAGLLWLGYLARRELVWVGVAFFFAVALSPAVEYLSRFMPRRNRGLAIGLVFLVALMLISFLIISLVPPLVQQSQSLSQHLPEYTNQLINGHNWLSVQVRSLNLVGRIQESQSQVVEYLSSAGSQAITVARSVFSSLVASLTVLGLTFFMLLEGPTWVAAFWRAVPGRHREHSRRLVDQMYRAVTGYVNGNLLTSLIAAIVTAVMLAIVRVPYAIPLGIFLGIMDLLPLVGATIGSVAILLVALFTSPTAAIIMAIFFVVYQQLENHALQPIVYGRTVEISPLLVLIAVLMGAAVGGIVGAIVAIPLFASLQILVKDYAQRRLSRD